MTVLDTVDARPQHLTALQIANEIRLARAADKRALAAASSSHSLELAAAIVLDPPAHMQGMKVIDLLGACRRMGIRSAQWVLFDMRPPLSETKRLGDMTDRQRGALATILRRKADQRATGRRYRLEVTAR